MSASCAPHFALGNPWRNWNGIHGALVCALSSRCGSTPTLPFLTSAAQPRAGGAESCRMRGPGRGRDCSKGAIRAPGMAQARCGERTWLLPGGQGSTACPLHKLQPLFFLCAGNLCPLGSKKAPRGKEKREREKENENDFNFFFFGVEMKLILKVSKF